MVMDSDQGKLFIGGISWETTEERLKDYFRAYGDVVEAVIMKDRTTGRARGFGFVVFADQSIADRVVLEKHTIDGRMVEAKKAVPRDEQQNVARNNNGGFVPVSQARTKKIFVGGLASTVTENDFKKYFEQFGTITDVVVMYDHTTQRPRGFGFITFDSEEAVDKVLQNSFHQLKDKMVEVKRAVPKELSVWPGRSNGGGLGTGSGRGGSYGVGYGQGVNSSPVGTYAGRVDSRYNSSPGGGYPPYGATGYGSSVNYGATMNGGYSAGAFGGGGYGAALSSSGGYGSNGAGSGYGNASGRNVWSSSYSSGGSTAGYGGICTSVTGGYGGVGTRGSTQTSGSSAGYGSSSHGYGSSDGAYGSSTAGYSGRGGYGSSISGYGSGGSGSGTGFFSGGYGDIYGSSGYGDPTWRSVGADNFNAASIGTGRGTGAYGSDRSSSGDIVATASGGYVIRRQSQQELL